MISARTQENRLDKGLSKRFEHPGHAQEAAFPNVLLGPANMHCCPRFSTQPLPQAPQRHFLKNHRVRDHQIGDFSLSRSGISGTYKLKSMAQQTVVFAQIPKLLPEISK